MMEMDGLDSVKCQKSRKRTQGALFERLINKTKHGIVFFFPKKRKIDSRLLEFVFRERMTSFSLDSRTFGPSILDGARSKVALRGEGYA